MDKVWRKKVGLGMLKKELNNLLTSNTMHFCIPNSLGHATGQCLANLLFGRLTLPVAIICYIVSKFSIIALSEANTSCWCDPYCTSQLIRDTEVHCVWRQQLVPVLFWHLWFHCFCLKHFPYWCTFMYVDPVLLVNNVCENPCKFIQQKYTSLNVFLPESQPPFLFDVNPATTHPQASISFVTFLTWPLIEAGLKIRPVFIKYFTIYMYHYMLLHTHVQ